MSDSYSTGLCEAEIEFKIRVQMRCRYKNERVVAEDEDFDDYDDYEDVEQIDTKPLHLVQPVMMKDAAVQKVLAIAKVGDKVALDAALEDFFTFRLFQMLGVRSMPPTILNGDPSEEDFVHPEYAKVLHMKDL